MVAALRVQESGPSGDLTVAPGCIAEVIPRAFDGIGLLVLAASRTIQGVRQRSLMAEASDRSVAGLPVLASTMLLVATAESAHLFDTAGRGTLLWSDGGQLRAVSSQPAEDAGGGDRITLHVADGGTFRVWVNGLLMPERLATIRALRLLCREPA